MVTSTGRQVIEHPVKRLVDAPVIPLAVAAVPRRGGHGRASAPASTFPSSRSSRSFEAR